MVSLSLSVNEPLGAPIVPDIIDLDDPEGLVLRIRNVRLRSQPNPSYSPSPGPHNID